MDIILVPGFWLTAASWQQVAPALVAAGHRVHPLTLPGLESVDTPRDGITLRDHVDAVVAAIDGFADPVVLVGHSGGGAIIHGAADHRPDRVLRTIYVDAGPLPEGASINDELPIVDDEVPLPDWSAFGEEELVGLTETIRAEMRANAIPEPQHVPYDEIEYSDERRWDIPATVICSSMASEMLQAWIDGGHPFTEELAHFADLTFIDLPTGHWPQFSRPAELGAAIVAAVG